MSNERRLSSIKGQPCMLTAYFDIGHIILPVIVDTGATISVIPENGLIMKRLRPKIKTANLNVIMADNFKSHMDKKVSLPVRPKGSKVSHKDVNFYVHNGADKIIGAEAIIGLDQLMQFDIQIKFHRGIAQIYHHEDCIGEQSVRFSEYQASIKIDDRFDKLQVDDKIRRMLKRYKQIFTNIGPEPIRGKPMRFITVHNRPIYSKMRKYTKSEIEQVKSHVQSMLEEGVIEPTRSGYSATSRIVPKKSGLGRLVVNYIPLNLVTLRDSYALPNISDILGVLQGMKYFTAMDCSQGFYQILVDPRDRHKTAFSTPIGNFQYIRCPFGARNSCAVFQAEMNSIFREGLYTKCAIYVDDILVFGRDRQEHDANLNWVLERALQYNVKIKLEKCTFCKEEVDYLGFKISGRCIKPLPSKVETLCQEQPPRDKTELRSLIGKLNFYSRFIPQFSNKLEPLRELFRKNKDFQWSARYQLAYQSILKSLNDAPEQYLEPRSTNKIVELHIMEDSLEVLCLTKDERLICRSSRFLSSSESNYSRVEKQLLALVLAMDKFRLWLEPENFTVRVHTNELEKVFKLVNRPERVESLLLRLPEGYDEFKFEIKDGLIQSKSKQLNLHMPQEIYYIDGACKNNGKEDCKAAWSVCCEFDQKIELTGFVTTNPSNQSAEVNAAIQACLLAKETGFDEITIVTDSKYLHNAATLWIDKWQNNEWLDHRKKPVMNAELFKQLLSAKRGLRIEWIHVKGHSDHTGNIRADALARSKLDNQAAALCAAAGLERNRFQPECTELERLKQEINSNLRPNYMIEEDVVYYIDKKDGVQTKQIYVPAESVPILLNLAHDNQVYGGHLGIKKTFEKLYRFWWPGKHKDVEEYIKSCVACQTFKRPNQKTGLLHSIPVSKIFENVHLDIIGPITMTTRGNKYIITATDAFSKWAFARPCQNIVTTEVIKFLEETIIAVYGEPHNLITDRGVQFTSHEWKRFLAKTSIKHALTSGYHPQANGIDERLNGTLVKILLSYVDDEQENWDLQLKWALYAYNTTRHSSTGYAPYTILHGLEPRSPFNAHLKSCDDVKLMKRIREMVRAESAKNNTDAQERQKAYYDRSRQPIDVQIGDLVWISEHACGPELSRKLQPKRFGPCVVIGVRGEPQDPKSVHIFDPVRLKKRSVAISEISFHHDRPSHLKQKKSKKGEAQAVLPCTDDFNSEKYYYDDQQDTEVDQADKISNDLIDTPAGTNDAVESADSSDTESYSLSDISSLKSFEQVDQETLELVENFNSSRERRVTISDEVQTYEYEPIRTDEVAEFDLVNLDEVDAPPTPERIRKSPYYMDFIIDDATKDPSYEPPELDSQDQSTTRYNLRSQQSQRKDPPGTISTIGVKNDYDLIDWKSKLIERDAWDWDNPIDFWIEETLLDDHEVLS